MERRYAVINDSEDIAAKCIKLGTKYKIDTLRVHRRENGTLSIAAFLMEDEKTSDKLFADFLNQLS